jgi:GNAT superfamily N-acetyltransferase
MNITTADTDEDRLVTRDFLAQYIDDIAPDAVPKLSDDDLYRPLVPWIRDASGRVVAAALTCRNRYAAGAAAISRRGDPMPPQAAKFLSVLDKHSELDLLAVRPDCRGKGLGTSLVRWMEQRLQERGARVWFGNVTSSLEVTDLRRFYASHGFTTTGPNEDLPPLLGRMWIAPNAVRPAFFFYKALTKGSTRLDPDHPSSSAE